eukprot:XP_001693407.1 predicted protein [Chlamydomonas reinhardtii]
MHAVDPIPPHFDPTRNCTEDSTSRSNLQPPQPGIVYCKEATAQMEAAGGSFCGQFPVDPAFKVLSLEYSAPNPDIARAIRRVDSVPNPPLPSHVVAIESTALDADLSLAMGVSLTRGRHTSYLVDAVALQQSNSAAVAARKADGDKWGPACDEIFRGCRCVTGQEVPIGEETDIICAEYDNLVSKGQFVTMDRFSGDHTVNMTGNALIQNDGKAISKGYAVAQRARVTSNVGAAWGYGGGGGFQELFGD